MTAISRQLNEPARATQLQGVQALRAVAALLVVFGHATHELETIAERIGHAPIDASFLHSGGGVDIFFVISGFIMVHTSADRFGRPDAWRIFLTRRIARIVPLYWLLTTTLLIGALVAPRLLNVPIGDWQHILASYFFVPSMRDGNEIRPVMALGWTLNLEMFFYLLFAIAMLFPLRRGLVALGLTLSILALIGAIWRPTQVQIAFWTQPIILEFLFGCLLALVYRRGVRIPAGAAAALVALGLAAMFRLPGIDDPALLPQVLRLGLPAVLVVAGAALNRGGTPRFAWPLAALGDASYSLYLSHPFALRPLRDIWVRLIGETLPLEIYLMVALVVAAFSAILLYRLIEQPMATWLHRSASARPPAESASGTTAT